MAPTYIGAIQFVHQSIAPNLLAASRRANPKRQKAHVG